MSNDKPLFSQRVSQRVSQRASQLVNQLITMQAHARQARHRYLVVFSGSHDWCRSMVGLSIPGLLATESLWIGDIAPDGITSIKVSKATQWLGRELELLVFDAHCGFDVDAFGALSGTLRGGGLLFLLVPELSRWPSFNDPEYRRIKVYPEDKTEVVGRYLSRLSELIGNSPDLSLLLESGDSRWQALLAETQPLEYADHLYKTLDQSKVVAAVKRVVTGHRRRPLVLTADRGRGKSAALGIAAAQLLNEKDNSVNRIIVTAPSMAAAEVIFRHAHELLNDDENVDLQFLAPDELIASDTTANLVLVDEAAAIPAPMLEQLLKKFARIAFASTVHGYEGTGRGFAVRFKNTLDRLTPKWKALSMQKPVRWADKDPLEELVFNALMLNAKTAEFTGLKSAQQVDYELVKFDRDQLVKDERRLGELFGLLVLAHYRTRPFDLRHLLDGPNIEVYGCLFQGQVVATLLAAREGGIGNELIEPIWLGQCRVRGHLIPQSLSNHVGIPGAIAAKGLRILRLAVLPEWQRQGVGKQLLDFATNSAKERLFDYVGSSFGATASLVQFWGSCGFFPVRVGFGREASSGCHAIMVLKPLSEPGNALATEAGERFLESFLFQLSDQLSELDPWLVRLILKAFPYKDHYQADSLTIADQQDIYSFAQGNRLYESCFLALRKQLLQQLKNTDELKASGQQGQAMMIMKILQNRDWSELAKVYGFAGKKQAISAFRQLLARQATSYSR